MNITDMKIDCLESSFEYLELGDLVSVASSSKRLNHVAEHVFAQKYSSKTVVSASVQKSHDRCLDVLENEIRVCDLRTILFTIMYCGALDILFIII